MKTRKIDLKSCSLMIISALSLCGCSIFSSPEAPPKKDPEIYQVAFRQLPPEPVYNRVKVVQLPSSYPARLKPHSKAAELEPQVKLKLKNNTLEQAGTALASLGNYQSYTASALAKQRVSLDAYGTLEEVAQQLALKSGAHIVIDHPNREIRILAGSAENSIPAFGIKPSFADNNN